MENGEWRIILSWSIFPLYKCVSGVVCARRLYLFCVSVELYGRNVNKLQPLADGMSIINWY